MRLWVLDMVRYNHTCVVLLLVVSVGSKRRFPNLAPYPFFLICQVGGYIGNNLMAARPNVAGIYLEHCYRLRKPHFVALTEIGQIGYIGNKLLPARLI